MAAHDHNGTINYVRKEVGETTAPITSYFAQVQDDPSIQIVNNAQLWYAKKQVAGTADENLPLLSAAAPFKAGTRGDATYYTDIPAGPLAIKNVADLYLYDNVTALLKVTGAQIKEWLEMSAGQFELRMYDLEKAGEGKNRGLDLMVYSTVTGKEREVRTLSGGESFMAALSLALGMADQIQQSSAAINLDMMFIDEGFGSLDEHSRNQAVRVLQEMAEGSRLIGIISHVSELKQEIEDQLLVNKDENGSHVKWQIS